MGLLGEIFLWFKSLPEWALWLCVPILLFSIGMLCTLIEIIVDWVSTTIKKISHKQDEKVSRQRGDLKGKNIDLKGKHNPTPKPKLDGKGVVKRRTPQEVGKALADKFSIVIAYLNDVVFNGTAEIIVTGTNHFLLHREGAEDIILFLYSKGDLIITWDYKSVFSEKGYTHLKTFVPVDNFSPKEQEDIAVIMCSDMVQIQARLLMLKD